MYGYNILMLTCQNSKVQAHHCNAHCISSPWLADGPKYNLALILNVHWSLPSSVKWCHVVKQPRTNISAQLHATITYPDQGDSKFFWNVSIPLPDYMASHPPKTQIFIFTTRKPHIWHQYPPFVIQVNKLFNAGHRTQSSVHHCRGIRDLCGTLYTAPGPFVTYCTLLKYITV